MLWDIRLRLALILLDLYLSKELMENMDDGTESLEDKDAAISGDAEEISIGLDEVFVAGEKKRKYQSLYSNSVTSGRIKGWWRVKGSRGR